MRGVGTEHCSVPTKKLNRSVGHYGFVVAQFIGHFSSINRTTTIKDNPERVAMDLLGVDL